MARNSALMQVLNTQTLKTLRQTGLDYFHFTEKQQRGITFGERLENALVDVLNRGYDSVICVGNDSPLLSKNHIEAAAAQLTRNQLVLGKSLDGGTYLIGINRAQIRELNFDQLRWQSAHLFRDMRERANDVGLETHVLAPLADLDCTTDLLQFLKGKNLERRLFLALKKAIKVFLPLPKRVQVQFSLVVPLRLFYNKGSPVVSL